MSVRILVGDALTQLRTLPDDSVQTCVTSPPYYGLRDYGLPPERCAEVEADGVTLTVDPTRSDLLLETELPRFAEPAERPSNGRRGYRLTPASLAAARDSGMTLAGLELWFQQRTGQPLTPAARLLLTGAHAGCEHGFCGACTVRVDGSIVRGCLVLAATLDGAHVETIEGVSDSGEIRDLQEAFIARNAAQCGYCTPGMLLTAADLLARSAAPTREEIRAHLSGNYCRCTGYHAIVDAVEAVAAKRIGKSAP